MPDLTELRASVVKTARNINGSDVPLRWRVIGTDSESESGVALVCPTEHPVFELETGPTPDATGVYDCCPWPQFETFSETVAAYLVALLNKDTAPADTCTYCRTELTEKQKKPYCSDRCRWADDDHGPDSEPTGDES